MTKSIKVNSIEAGATLYTDHSITDRYATAYRSGFCADEPHYVLAIGTDGYPADYKEHFESLSALEDAMREFQSDLRKWSYAEH